MAEVGPGQLVRPLLSVDRVTILNYLAAIGAGYVVDSSNLETRALRNRVRMLLLPELERNYAPGIARRLTELATEMRDSNSFIDAAACRFLERRLSTPGGDASSSCRLDVRGFESVGSALIRATMRELIRRGFGSLRGIERSHIEQMCRTAVSDNPSAAVTLPSGWRFRREYDTAILEHGPSKMIRDRAAADRPVALSPGANSFIAGGCRLFLREITDLELSFPSEPWHLLTRFEAYFDAAEAPVLTVRCFRRGDRIRPLGLDGSRKLHDVFVDFKVTASSRTEWPLVLAGDEIVWVPGLVRSASALISAATRRVLHLRADSLPGGLKV